MRVYLVQHGEATPKDVNPERPLSDKGRRDVEKVAGFIKPLGLKVKAVSHSGKARAAQTAQILGGAVSASKGIQSRDGIAPNDTIEPLKDELDHADEDMMVVGHLPFLGKLAASLVAGAETSHVVSFRQGGVVCLERSEEGRWSVAWMVTPELIR